MEFIETPTFTRQITTLLSDEDYRGLQNDLVERPDRGDLIKGGGGIRKVRYAQRGRGKSGGIRVIYYWVKENHRIYMLVAYPKIPKGQSQRQGNSYSCATGKGVMTMDKELFDDLVQSLKEAGDIARGVSEPSRRFDMTPTDVKAARENIGLSQGDFARLMRVSVKTLQNWEQHRRTPTGPAAALLKIVVAEPEVALKSLHG